MKRLKKALIVNLSDKSSLISLLFIVICFVFFAIIELLIIPWMGIDSGYYYQYKELFLLVLSTAFIYVLMTIQNKIFQQIKKSGDIVFYYSPSGIAVIQQEGIFIKVNANFTKLTGYSEAELMQLNITQLIAKETTDIILQEDQTFDHKFESQSIVIKHAMDKFISVNITFKHIEFNGRTNIILFVDEISELKQRIIEFSQSEEKFNTVFSLAPISMALVNITQGKRFEVNNKMCELTEYTQQELIEYSIFKRDYWQSPEELKLSLEKLTNNNELSNFETNIITKSGKIKTVSINAVKLASFNSGSSVNNKRLMNKNDFIVLTSMVDITETKRMVESVKIVAEKVLIDDSDDFYFNFIHQVYKAFHPEHAFIAELKDKKSLDVNTLVYIKEGEIESNFSFQLNNTPCADVYNNKTCYYLDNIQKLFPKDVVLQQWNIQSYIGIPILDATKSVVASLVLLFEHPITLPNYWRDILQTFAAKITSEMIHQQENNQLRISEQNLQHYRKQAPLASMEWDTECKLIAWNLAAEEMFGYKSDEINVQDCVASLIPDEQRAKIKGLLEGLFKGYGEHFIIEMFTKSGEKISCEWNNTVIINKQKKMIGVTSIIRNITLEQKYLTSVINEERDKQEIINMMVDAVFTINEQGIVLSVNDSALSIFGYKKDELIGNNISVLMPPNMAIHHNDYLQKYLQTGKGNIIGVGRELTAVRKDGTEFLIWLMISELSLNNNGERRLIGICHDLSESKKQQELINRIQKMDALGKLTGGIAHDFNNILGVILGYSDLVLNNLGGEIAQEQLTQYCEQIVKASNRGANLTRKLLAFSSKKSTNTEVVNLNEIIEANKDILSKALTVEINMIFNCYENLWLIKIEINAFEDLLLNLCINAKHAMSDGGEIKITTANKNISFDLANKYKIGIGDYVCLTVEDNGCGMLDEVKNRIFEPFYTTKGEAGTGLGLAQVYGFIQSIGGAINVYSEVNIGTCFTLYLPRVRLRLSNEKIIDHVSETADLSGSERILVVDDEPALSELAKTILENECYKVTAVNSAEQALNCLTNNTFDLLLSDIIMPKMNGYLLAEQVQLIAPNMAILFASGFQDNKMSYQKAQFPNTLMVQKPYSSVDLLQYVRKSLDENHENETLPDVDSWMSLIDRQHEKINTLLLEFYNIDCTTISTEEFTQKQQYFISTMIEHFKTEEKLMLLNSYEHINNHKSVHKLIINNIKNVLTNKSKEEVQQWFITELKDIYETHNTLLDARLYNYILDATPKLLNGK